MSLGGGGSCAYHPTPGVKFGSTHYVDKWRVVMGWIERLFWVGGGYWLSQFDGEGLMWVIGTCAVIAGIIRGLTYLDEGRIERLAARAKNLTSVKRAST